MTKEDIIRQFEQRFSQDFLDDVDAYVAARTLRMIEHGERNDLSFEELKDHLTDTIIHWMGG